MPLPAASSPLPMGESAAFRALMAQVSRAAPLNRPTLVIGERGTGKELVAARLHYLSRRWERPFIKLNCAALSETLLETELFGHEAGAFTGAVRRHLGRFELANGGTLFLDEIATSSPRVQEKILRVIEYGEFERVGGSQTLITDVRLIGATNADLPALAAEGKFRADLLDRLAFEVITVPPLRARREDIPLLAEHFALGMTREMERPYFAGFTPEALDTMLAHSWPGNVRELKNVVERAVFCLPEAEAAVETVTLDPFASPWRPVETPALVDEPVGNFAERVAAFERSLLETALRRHRFHQKRAAEELGLTYHQFRGLLRKYRIGLRDTDGHG